ncbi:hypothetical protein K439DRAFT_1611999 [Ramaria rubella]|nr:hypothetical protein K439DRAFT_1611999 [Ramaria rubella]
MNDEDIWLKSLVIENVIINFSYSTDEIQDPLDLLKHGWLLQKYEKPPIMMLIQQYGQEMRTEVGFRLQGILVDMKLPLVHVLEKNIRGMHQYVTITGLDQVVFNNSLKAIYALHDLYGKFLKEGVVDQWMASSYQNYPAASFSSRYLLPKSHGEAIAISNLVDPLGLIESCSRPDAEMNAPVYTYELVDPALFRLGHMVELQVAFYLRPNSSIDQALLKIKMDKGDYHKPKFMPPCGLKRVSGIQTLEDQQVELARKEMHKLAVQDMTTNSRKDTMNTSMDVDRSSKTARAE